MNSILSSPMNRTTTSLRLAAVLGWAVSAGSMQSAVVGQWDFAGGLNATTGVSLEYFDGPGGATETGTQFGTTTALGIPDIAGQAATVMRVPKTTSAMGYVMNPNAAGNGGGALLNQYSLVLDVYFPAASNSKNRCLLQIDEPWLNSNDGEFYVTAGNGLGTAANPHGSVTAEAWHRLAITVDLTASPPRATKYIDGVRAGEETLADVLDGRWALGTSRALWFTDSAGAFEVAYINSIQVHDAVLSPGHVAALGAPAGDAIPSSVEPVAIVNAVRPASGEAFVLPGTTLEADLLPAGQAIPADSVQMWLDGVAVPRVITSPGGGIMRISHDPGLLAPESAHTVRLSYVDPAAGPEAQELEWSFRMSPYHLAPPDPVTEGQLYLGFEEAGAADGSPVLDRSPALNHGVVRLAAEVTDLKAAGVVSNGLDFTINQTVPQSYVELANGLSLVPNTFAAWVKLEAGFPTATRGGVMLGNYPAANAINWEIHTSGRPRVYWGYNSGSLVDWIVSDDLRSGEWEHVVFVRDSTQGGFSYYRNGRLAAVRAGAGPNVLPVEPPYVGSDRRTSGFQPFRGGLDEVMVFARPLNSNEVFRLFTARSTFPKYLFATPPIARLQPADGAVAVAVTTGVEVLVDEASSSNTVNLASVQLSINGAAVTPGVVRSGGNVIITGAPTSPLAPSTTNQIRVRYLDHAAVPQETIRVWSFVTGELPAVPVVVWLSEGTTVAVGDEVNLAVRASGEPPLSYQWRRDGVPLAEATSALLTLPAVTLEQTGDYDAVVSSPHGSVTSSVVRVVVSSSLALAGLREGVMAHYAFEAEVGGVVSNAARAVGYPGFNQDHATLNGADGDPSALQPPLTTDPARVRAGAGALDCDGAGDYGDIVGNPVVVGQDWSVSVWFKPDTGGAGYSGSTRAFVLETGSVYPISFGLRAGTAGNSNFQLFSDYETGSDPSRDFQVPNAQVDQWHQVVIVYRTAAAALEAYLDGVLTHQISVTGTLNPNHTGLRVGTYRSANGRWFKGQIDELALWQRALAVGEITALHGAGEAGLTLATRIGQAGGEGFRTDLTAYYGFDAHTAWVVSNGAPAVGGTGSFADDALTLMGGALDPAARIYPITHDPALARVGQGALIGDGLDNYAHVNGNPVDPNRNWSCAAWFKPDTGGLGLVDTARAFVFESTGTDQPPISFGLRAGTPDPITGDLTSNFQVYTHTSSGVAHFRDYMVSNIEVDQWHHVALTYDAAAGVLKGYLDGRETHLFTLGPGTTLQSYAGFNLGTYRAADGRWFPGWIDEVTLWQRTLSPAAVAQAVALGNDKVNWLVGAPKILGLAPQTSPPGSFLLSWQATAGQKYTIEASSNLTDWTHAVATDHVAAAETVSVVISPTQPPPANGYYDSGLSGAAQRYYRIRWNL